MIRTIVQRHINPDDSTKPGKFIAAFNSSVTASKQSKVPYTSLRYVVRGRKHSLFTFKEECRDAMHHATRGKKRITQRSLSSIVVAVYASLEVASKNLGISVDEIQAVLNTDKVVAGHTFNG